MKVIKLLHLGTEDEDSPEVPQWGTEYPDDDYIPDDNVHIII